jgi:hypothetical protein
MSGRLAAPPSRGRRCGVAVSNKQLFHTKQLRCVSFGIFPDKVPGDPTCGRGILVVGTDTNNSIGVRSWHGGGNAPDRDRVRGPFGIPHDNFRERELHAVLGLHQLALPTTLVLRRTARGGGMGRRNYRYAQTTTIQAPRIHSRSTIFVKQNDIKRVRDAEAVNWGAASDH